MIFLRICIVFIIVLCARLTVAQLRSADTLNYRLINSMALKGEIRQLLKMFDTVHLTARKDIDFKNRFEQRFKFEKDKTGALDEVPEDIRSLTALFHTYWRRSLLDTAAPRDEDFKRAVVQLLADENKKTKFTRHSVSLHTIDSVFGDYVHAKHYYATEFGRTGYLFDLISWKDMRKRPYTIELIDDTIRTDVNFIDSFISLGWIAYARLGNSSPGGWATKDALYCVQSGYDTSSEKFLLSFLKHEAQHFSDFEKFPALESPGLEYRGKLVELRYAREELFSILQAFIRGAKYDRSNAHPFANFCIIRDLSRRLLHKDFEGDIGRWRSLQPSVINEAANVLYAENTALLKAGGKLE